MERHEAYAGQVVTLTQDYTLAGAAVNDEASWWAKLPLGTKGVVRPMDSFDESERVVDYQDDVWVKWDHHTADRPQFCGIASLTGEPYPVFTPEKIEEFLS